MSIDGTSTSDGDAERFAAAVDGPADTGAADPELAREIALARRLAALRPDLDPDPDARERARRRLRAALAGDPAPDDGAPRTA